MPVGLAYLKSDGSTSWLGLTGCLLGTATLFVMLPDSAWASLLPSLPSKLFPPMFATAFAAGWAAAIWRLKTGQDKAEGSIRSQACVAGLLTSLVACFAAYAASSGSSSTPLVVALAFGGLGLLPSGLFAAIGASLAQQAGNRGGSLVALAASASLPAAGVLVWPSVYVVGKVLEKPSVPVVAPIVATAPALPKPRYVKPEGFDSANAWERIVSREDAILNADAKSPIELSHDERLIAFSTRENGGHQLVVRHLYDPGPDYSLPVDGGIAAMAWSPDDRRILFLSSDRGELWICVPNDGKVVRLPIPVLETGQHHGLVWWRNEHVVIYPSRGDPFILSLDSLRITTANEVPEWSKLTDSERARIGQDVFPPDVGRTATAKFAFIAGTGDASRSLSINDDESFYARLMASAERGFASAFPNRDGTMFFISEQERLRILYMGLRQSPPLRFIAEAKSNFPPHPAVKAALDERSVRAAVAAPIINPLNGKTVAGDPTAIKGYARFIAANDKTCSVWIEQEREPIREGDVLITLSVIQNGDEYSASADWWAVLKTADVNQSIPRRSEVKALLPSSTRVLRPLPRVIEEPDIAPRMESGSGTKPDAATKPLLPTSAQSYAAPLQNAGDAEFCRTFLADHYAKAKEKDLPGVMADYSESVLTEVGVETKDQIAARLKNSWSNWLEPETIVSPLETRHLGGSRFSLIFSTRRTLPSVRRGFLLHEYSHEMHLEKLPQGYRITKHIVRPP